MRDLNKSYIFMILGILSFLISCSKGDDPNHSFYNLKNNFLNVAGVVKNGIDNFTSEIPQGVWATTWNNIDGYPISEFISVDGANSYLCVVNHMNGVEYSKVFVEFNKISTTFIDPDKKRYLNEFARYGKDKLRMSLIYSKATDVFSWEKRFTGGDRSTSYERLNAQNKYLSNIFESKCASFSKPNVSSQQGRFLFSELKSGEFSGFKTVIQKDISNYEKNLCIFNDTEKTVLVIPAQRDYYNGLVFSDLDVLSEEDQQNLFQEKTNYRPTVDDRLMSVCQNAPRSVETAARLPQTGEVSTHLVCRYKNGLNGSNSGWEWGERPRWEWERHKTTCKGLNPSNCYELNGRWTRQDGALGAIGTMFVVDADSRLEADFSRACRYTNGLTSSKNDREYAQYYVADHAMSFNHTVWFSKVRPDKVFPDLPFDRIISLGDSLSDSGNIHIASRGVVAAGNYFQGRFSNGHVWAEFLSKKLHVDLHNWASGGATTDIGGIEDYFKTSPYSLVDQIRDLERAVEEIPITQDEIKNSLFTLLIGGNNFLRDVLPTPEAIMDGISQTVYRMTNLGARYILLSNLPDVSIAPHYLGSDESVITDVREKVLRTNKMIHDFIVDYNLSHKDSKIIEENLFVKVDDALLNPAKYYLKNVENKCYTGKIWDVFNKDMICNTPENFLFWDPIHPTTTFHCESSEEVLQLLLGTFKISTPRKDYWSCVKSILQSI